ncbi:hypothetical protein [Olleya sp. HaHaR_3_96]|uniref:hypothetical protein n=1 Tax=Olleya sp. HaHaR_3_96 TaxID=2745560 RepID=UPI001C4F7FAD|nr:hypothetical protein [Olleya sp. HaHaR_3_96]QXP59800.1 hypothetical protein H0I26_18120 [Olleya sp. HaHaR_3_96]
MKFKVFFTLAFGLLLFAQQGVAQTQKKQQTQLVKYKKNVAAPLTAKEMGMLQEVYQDKLQTYVLSNPQRVKDFKHLLRNRVSIKKIPSLVGNKNKYQLISDAGLFNNYNGTLVMDKSYDPSTFNVLKYNLQFFGIGSSIYRIDNTEYFIIIKSQTITK